MYEPCTLNEFLQIKCCMYVFSFVIRNFLHDLCITYMYHTELTLFTELNVHCYSCTCPLKVSFPFCNIIWCTVNPFSRNLYIGSLVWTLYIIYMYIYVPGMYINIYNIMY